MNTTQYATTLLQLGKKAGDIPTYGTPAWEALPNADPRRFAAVVAAAEKWRLWNTDQAIADELKRELDTIDRITRQRIRDAGIDVWDATHTEQAAG